MKKAASTSAKIFSRASKRSDEQYFNGVLCLMFNGMASVIAIVFLILFITGKTGTLLWLGFAGCACMTLANTTDLFPLWLSQIAKKLAKNM